MGRMTTTIIELPDPIHRSAERRAVLENVPLPELILNLVASALTESDMATEGDFQDWRAELL